MTMTDPRGAGATPRENGAARANLRWLCLIATAAALAIAGVYLSLPWLHYAAKPAATLLIAAMVWRTRSSEPGYRAGILAGLLLSTLGDVFLMLHADFFAFGLASFLLAHLAYLFAFTRRERLFAVAWPMLAYAAAALMALTVLWPELPQALHMPVLVYISILATMAAQAATVWRRRRDRASALAAAGGLFFVASDSMLAINQFVAPFAASALTVLATYWIAQSLIGLSTARGET